MGGAIARGLSASGLGGRLLLIDPAASTYNVQFLRKLGASFAQNATALTGLNPEAIILAVKPQAMSEVAPDYALAAKDAVVISIAAGMTIDRLFRWLDSPSGLVRAMPNLPASIGKGITAAFATPTTSMAQRQLSENILRAIGDFVWLGEEQLLNAVTAVSGSGPAYVFLLTEALSIAAEKMGIPQTIAKLLARKTVEGAGALLSADPAEASDLRQSVTSSGGTTDAALKILMANGHFQKLVTEAVEAATARAFALEKS